MRNLITFFCLLLSLNLFADYCVDDFFLAGDPANDPYRVGCDIIMNDVQIRLQDNTSNCLSTDTELTMQVAVPFNGYDFLIDQSEFYYYDANDDLQNVTLSWTFISSGATQDFYEVDIDIDDLSLTEETHLFHLKLYFVPLRELGSGVSEQIRYRYEFESESSFTALFGWNGTQILGRIISGSLEDFIDNDPNWGEFLEGIYVDDELIVDLSINLFMEITGTPGYKIRVTSDGFGTFFTGEFHGCDAMWKGIEIEDGAWAGVYGQISDAEIAIKVKPGGRVDLSGASLSQNVIGLELSASDASLYNTEISSDPISSWLSTFSGQSELPISNRGKCGIKIEGGSDCTVSVCDIETLIGGIHNENSRLTCYNTFIDDMADLSSTLSYSGVGINLEGSGVGFAQIYDDGDAGSPTVNIQNCEIGIKNRGMRFSLKDCKIDKVDIGVDMRNTIAGRQEIDGNQIKARDYALYFENNRAANVRVTDNTLRVISGGSVGSERACVESIGNYFNWKFEDNTLNLDQAEDGFSSRINRFHTFRNNTISLNSSVSSHGVRSENDIVPRLYCNTAQDGTEDNSIGFYIKEATSYVINCNEATDVDLGFNFNSDNIGEDRFSGNSCGGKHGLYVDGNSITSVQNHTGNCWAEDMKAKHLGSQGEIDESKFYVDKTDDNNSNDCYWPLASPSNGWFLDEPGNSYICSATPSCPEGTGSVTDICNSGSYEDMIQNPLTGKDTSRQWYREFQIYFDLRELNCDIISSALDSFVDAEADGIRDHLYITDSVLHKLSLNMEDEDSTIAGNYLEISVLADSIGELRLDTVSDHSTTIASLQEDIDELYDDIDYLDSLISKSAVNLLEQRLDSIGDLSTTNVHEKRMRVVYLRWLELMLNPDTTWTSNQIDKLEEIADLCPYDGRWATAHARALLMHVGAYLYNDSLLCSGGGALIDGNSKETKLAHESLSLETGKLFKIYPNPLSSELTVIAKKGDEVHLVNQFGQLIMHKDILGRVTKLDVDHLTPGLYTILIRLNNEIIYFEKVVKK